MALTPANNDVFYREVDEELRRDQIGDFWKRYGVAMLVLAGLIVAAVAGYVIWQNEQKKAAGAEAETLMAVLTDLSDGKEAGTGEKLATLAKSPREGPRATALMTKAGFAITKGDTKGAAAAYGQIAADAGLPQPYRDLATVRRTAIEFDTLAPRQVIDRLKPLAVRGNPWFGSAGEMTGAAYLKLGKPELAAPIFAAIAKDKDVPDSMKARAVQMAGSLGIDAVVDSSKTIMGEAKQ